MYQLLCMIGWTSLPALPFMKKETLIMMGEEDQIVPLINGKMLKALIPHSRLEIFEQGGHLFMLTHREQTISSLRGFLNAPDRIDRKAA
jgi:pimeloyl-ACP methyl ester carboxylesterase